MGLVGRDLDLELEPQTAAQVLFALRSRSPGARVWHVYVHVHVYVRVHFTPVSTDPSRSPSRGCLPTVVRTRTRTRPRQTSWCACPCAQLVSSKYPSVRRPEQEHSLGQGTVTSLPNRTFTAVPYLCLCLCLAGAVDGQSKLVTCGWARASQSQELYNSNLLNTQVLSPYTHTSVLSTNLARLDCGVPNGTRRDRASYGSGFQPTDSDSEPVSILGFGGKEGRVLQREVPVARSLRPEA